jgi:serine/threonine-protein kinase HipA
MLPTRPLLAGENGMRLSLAGAQGKLAVMIRDGKYHLSLEGAPSSHILKPESQHYSGLVENEFTCMRLAKAIGLEVAEVQMEITGEVEFLQVTRYDRMALKGGGLERVHQEDFCQALGIVPELKYQQEGGPNLKQCFNLIREVSTVPGLDVLRFFDAVIFNFLIGNNDAHGKNFSFLYTNTGVRLAPLYDLVCTQAYPDLADKMAMKIGGQRNPARLTPKNWEKFCEDAGLSVSASAKRIKQLVARTGEAIHELENSERSSKRVLDVVARNRVLLQSD